MALERFGEQHLEVTDKYINPAVDFQMRTYDYVVRPAADGISGPITITLPPVAEAKGRFYSIIARNADAVNTITVEDKDDSECWGGDITLNGKCGHLLMYSDGLAWHAIGSPGAWPGLTTTSPPGTTAAPSTTLAPTTAAPQ